MYISAPFNANPFSRIVLATDDDRIYAAAEALSIPVFMTDPNHPSGTDRVLETAEKLDVQDEDVVVNIQGDEPLLEPDMLETLIQPFRDSHVQVTTPAKQIDRPGSQKSRSCQSGNRQDRTRALFFAKPHPLRPPEDRLCLSGAHRHLCLQNENPQAFSTPRPVRPRDHRIPRATASARKRNSDSGCHDSLRQPMCRSA